ncbi:NonF-related protein [Vibrio chagasii]|uniref:type 1 glutamine amidotransferase domain-containing protein n=1 Tax=Vibrio TaxID=662 RepID=UPI000CF49D18|nr:MULTISPECIES: type 1 glutamine amidotransferase domain-containing protein [Vibrio]MCG9560842.1 type 1 glutamine amidotransferase domain-containing protein [Vibrio chagasii]NOI41394.1 type 1 glutamine amidotransferase domain-containing protein [Vibrio sp. 070316B]NOI94253.1 type 1 glutamine amidotransferase domain-containing protein [Vibrio sp. T3Y01]PQJ56575.1 type 1 glutamine amidotransferase domain-containing protein [Vibrio splendidus]CAH6785300.1 NonF-related protein [Vibrio chagasii]
MKKILIPVTNHATLGETDQANGTYAPELTHALKEILAAGFEYDIASINGGKAPLYGTDIEGDTVNTEILANDDFQNRINNTIPVSQINADSYDAIFYPGGFGLLSDLAANDQFASIAAKHYEDGGVVAAVCHGPAALLPIVLNNGETLLSSKSVTGFTREEEIDFGTINDIPFLLEESLTRGAARFNKVQPWQELVIVDERVITGQNPTSAHAVGVAIVEHLS